MPFFPLKPHSPIKSYIGKRQTSHDMILKFKIFRFLSILLLFFGVGALGFSSLVFGTEIWNQSTQGGELNRSFWFIHPTNERPPIVIVKDHYYSHNPNEIFTLVVHGLGEINLTKTGAIWTREAYGVQVEIFGEIQSLQTKLEYNAEFKRNEPYLLVTFAEKGEMDCLWMAIALENNTNTGVQPVSIQQAGALFIINNTITVCDPSLSSNPVSLNTIFHPNEPFFFDGELLVEANGTSPFVMASNLIEGQLAPQTFEYTLVETIQSENNTIDAEIFAKKPFVPLMNEATLISIIPHLPYQSPWIYCNDSQRTEIWQQITQSSSSEYSLLWNAINKTASNAMKYNFSDNRIATIMSRSAYARDLAFSAWITQNSTQANQAAEIMKLMHDHIARIEEDPKMLHHGINLGNYILAWDFIGNLIEASTNVTLTQVLWEYAQFVADYLPKCGKNNWELVVSSGVGLAGLKFHHAGWIAAAFAKLDHYLTENVRIEGGIYEGQGYIGYAFDSFKRFLIGCSRMNVMGLPNYFLDRRLQAVYEFAVRCVTPDGYFPLFEDANPGTSGADNGFVMAPFFEEVAASELAKQLVWVYNRINLNATSMALEKLLFANYSLPAQMPSLPGRYPSNQSYSGASYLALDSGIAIFRDSWAWNTSLLTVTAKTYPQSHVHADEFTFEFWGYGQKLLANPGYPGWGLEHHNWTVITEASNGGVLFSGKGQNRDTCSPGIVQWLRGNYIDYLELRDTNLYAAPINPIVGENYVWVVPTGYFMGLCCLGLRYYYTKKGDEGIKRTLHAV